MFPPVCEMCQLFIDIHNCLLFFPECSPSLMTEFSKGSDSGMQNAKGRFGEMSSGLVIQLLTHLRGLRWAATPLCLLPPASLLLSLFSVTLICSSVRYYVIRPQKMISLICCPPWNYLGSQKFAKLYICVIHCQAVPIFQICCWLFEGEGAPWGQERSIPVGLHSVFSRNSCSSAVDT